MSHNKESILLGLGQENFNPERGEEELYLLLQFSDFKGYVYTNDNFFKTYQTINTNRLEDIHSLSNLSPIDQNNDVKNQYLRTFEHTRDNHTFIVAAVGNQILSNSNFPEKEIKKFLAAAFLHDLATPAYGDSTKFIDLNNLHEELYWREMLDEKSKDYILNEVGITLEEIDNIIKNKGILGEILDISDRITYVMQDADQAPFMHDFIRSEDSDVNYLKSKKNNLGNIYKDVCVDKSTNSVYFSNPSNLYDFLLLRALLYKNIYFHPINQGRDMVVANKIRPFYTSDTSRTDLINPLNLRSMTDYELVNNLANKYKMHPMQLSMELGSWQPDCYEKFQDMKSAQNRSEELKKSNKNVFGIKECKGFNPSTSYKVKDKSGQIIEYRQYNSQGAKVIEDIAKKVKGVFLYYEDKNNPHQNLD